MAFLKAFFKRNDFTQINGIFLMWNNNSHAHKLYSDLRVISYFYERSMFLKIK
jgi:hypothetical protein